MAQFSLSTLLLQIKLLLWKNFKLKTRRWKEILLMIAFAVFSMLLIGLFRSDVESQTIPASEPNPSPFTFHSTYGILAIINKLPNTDENKLKINLLQSFLNSTYKNKMQIWTNITSDDELDRLIAHQQNDTSNPFDMKPQIKVALDINKWDDASNTFDYTIRLPSAWVPSSSAALIQSDQEVSTQSMAQMAGMGSDYSTKFIPLQMMMDQFFMAYIKTQGNYNTSLQKLFGPNGITIKYQPFWTKQHEEDPFMDSMGSLLPFYIVSCFLLPFSYMIKDVVEEKSQKIKGM